MVLTAPRVTGLICISSAYECTVLYNLTNAKILLCSVVIDNIEVNNRRCCSKDISISRISVDKSAVNKKKYRA